MLEFRPDPLRARLWRSGDRKPSRVGSVAIKLVMASGSPRRKELSALTGWEIEVHPVALNEEIAPGELAEDYVRRMALEKAQMAADLLEGEEIILAADTIVVDQGTVLGKPQDSAEAERILMQLRGREHEVITAIALIDPARGRTLVDLCRTSVPMRAYSHEEVRAYVTSGDPLDKAGSYAIQNHEFQPVDLDQLNGCFANVMGLPLCHLQRSMQDWGYLASRDIPRACIQHTRYDCRVYPMILDRAL